MKKLLFFCFLFACPLFLISCDLELEKEGNGLFAVFNSSGDPLGFPGKYKDLAGQNFRHFIKIHESISEKNAKKQLNIQYFKGHPLKIGEGLEDFESIKGRFGYWSRLSEFIWRKAPLSNDLRQKFIINKSQQVDMFHQQSFKAEETNYLRGLLEGLSSINLKELRSEDFKIEFEKPLANISLKAPTFTKTELVVEENENSQNYFDYKTIDIFQNINVKGKDIAIKFGVSQILGPKQKFTISKVLLSEIFYGYCWIANRPILIRIKLFKRAFSLNAKKELIVLEYIRELKHIFKEKDWRGQFSASERHPDCNDFD